MTVNYYNDTDPKVCAWAKELIKAKLVPDGEVDCRSIEDVRPDEIKDFIQCHFFCGILGWPLALRLSGWPDDKPIWTGSCPCQPFSQAGQGKGVADERHLWPAFKWHIEQRKPPVVIGEQVASADGREWLAGVRADLEDLGYAVGSADLCAAGVGAPHIRQRLYWVADSGSGADNNGPDLQGAKHTEQRTIPCGQQGGPANGSGLVLPDSDGCGEGSFATEAARHGDSAIAAGFWSDFQLVHCRDGKTRRIAPESALFPLVDGLSYQLARRRSIIAPLIRGPGNAIVPQVAAEFVKAYLET